MNVSGTIGSVSDCDGNDYRTIIIGTQVWMAENLRVRHYNNGEDISTTAVGADISNFVSYKFYWAGGSTEASSYSGAADSVQQLVNAGAGNLTLDQAQNSGFISSASKAQFEGALAVLGYTPAQIAAMNINTIKTIFSTVAAITQFDRAYYTWSTITDSRKVCPAGWHIPSFSECLKLVEHLGGEYYSGGHLKESGMTHWFSPNTGADNSSGFEAIPFGVRNPAGRFNDYGRRTGFWSATEYDSSSAWLIELKYDDGISHLSKIDCKAGYSIRCLKD